MKIVMLSVFVENSARSTDVDVIVVDEPRSSKVPAATVVTTAAVGATRGTKVQQPQEKQPVQGCSSCLAVVMMLLYC